MWMAEIRLARRHSKALRWAKTPALEGGQLSVAALVSSAICVIFTWP